MLSFATKHSLRVLAIAIFVLGVIQPVRAQAGVDATVQFVEGQPKENEMAHNVTAYVTVTDSAGNAIKDLRSENFTLTEDAQQVSLLSADLVSNEPIHLVLLLDTSGSMSGTGIEAAKVAAANFLNSLNADDRVAILSFSDSVETIIGFTNDLTSLRNELNVLQATRGAGTCLYDAAYQAIQLTATVPSGRRAVVLFTDGVDERLGGGPCSSHTPEDVISLAREGGTRTPIYTLGMGAQVDQNSLKRLAESTGGRFLYSPDPSLVDSIFQLLADSLRSQYALRYTSTAGPGPHTLAVTVNYFSAQDTDTRNFLLPNFPLRLAFLQPAEGAQLNGKVILQAEASGQGGAIQTVVFQVNNATIGSDATSPYEVEVDLNAYPEGDLILTAIAQAADGSELARVTRTVRRVAAAPTAPTATPAPGGLTEGARLSLIILLVLIVLGIIFVGVVIFLFVFFRRRAEQKRRDAEWDRQVGGIGEPPAPPAPVFDRTLDAWDVSPDALGMFIVAASDDASMINHRFEITKSLTTIGRSADNDIPFPKDSPVSRRHAQVEERSGGLWISEVESVDQTGVAKRPTYGTFVNETPINTEPVLLASGDEVRLGKRVRLRYQAGQRLMSGEAKTMDQFENLDPNATQEM